MFKRFVSSRYARIGLVAILAVVAVAAISLLLQPALQAQAAPQLAPAGPMDYFACSPIESAVFYNRIHVRCSNSPNGAIYYFAAQNTDSGLVSRYLSIITTAVATGKQVRVWYTPTDNGSAWGCGTGDCRPMWGVTLLP